MKQPTLSTRQAAAKPILACQGPTVDFEQSLTFSKLLFSDGAGGLELTEYRLIHPITREVLSVWGTLESRGVRNFLAGYNRRGYGVYMVINRLVPEVEERIRQGKAAQDINVIGVRAVFVELDRDEDSPGANLRELQEAPLAPSIIVCSSLPHKLHAYWRVADLPVSEFRAVQRHLIKRFGGDSACKNESRVMRVPGFFHTKGDLIRSELLMVPGTLYTRSELLEAFGIDLIPPRPVRRSPLPQVVVGGKERRYGQAALAAEVMTVSVATDGQRHCALIRAAANLGELVGAGVLTCSEVFDGLAAAAERARVPMKEAKAAIAWGLAKGQLNPRRIPDRHGNYRQRRRAHLRGWRS